MTQVATKDERVERARELIASDGLSVRAAAKRVGLGRTALAVALDGGDSETLEHERVEGLAQRMRDKGYEATAQFLERSEDRSCWVVRVVVGENVRDLLNANDVSWFLREHKR